MLTIYIDKTTLPVEHDVEKLFSQTKLTDTPLNRKLIQVIEQGTYNDPYSFIDRFGFKLYTEDMSTGCKAALCVANNPDKVVDLVECGYNARDAIIHFCNTGNILYHESSLTIESMEEHYVIDVALNGYHFTSVDRLNKYIQDEMIPGVYPDLDREGIEKLEELERQNT